jgi:superfamily II DNA/RNA helicase
MSYLKDNEPNIIEDIIQRKEFYWAKKWNIETPSEIENFIPKFLIQESSKYGVKLKPHSYQIFIENLLNPNTPYKRLLLLWDTGIGKTIASLLSAMKFIEHFRLESESGNKEIGSVFIIGFSEKVFKNDLLRFPEFGFLNRDEKIELERIKKIALNGSIKDIEIYKERIIKIRKRLSNRRGNGFFKFYGYKAFVNRIFIPKHKTDLTIMTEEQIKDALKSGEIKYNEELLLEFKNSLIICDEIHNVYNSIEKNNWGIAIQSVLDKEPTCKAIFMSATPINNSPTEIIDILNLLVSNDEIKKDYGKEHLKREDFFKNEKELKPNALEQISRLCRGKISFVKDTNPQYFPELRSLGENIPGVSYLKFIRCPMTKFHYKTYSSIYKGTLSQDSQYLMDFVLPNPNDENIGIYQTDQIKQIYSASQTWKNKYEIDYIDNKIVGDICQYDNLKKYSNKYVTLLDIINDIIKNRKGKICIYHNVVHMSGVLFIAEILIRNGILDENTAPSDNTLCVICGKTKKEHNIKSNKIEGGGVDLKEIYNSLNDTNSDSYNITSQKELDILNHKFDTNITNDNNNDTNTTYKYIFNNDDHYNISNDNISNDNISNDNLLNNNLLNNKTKLGGNIKYEQHEFKPVRFVIAHSEIDKSSMEQSIEKFNHIDNVWGDNFLILVGSKVIKESMDIKAIQNMIITRIPDNIQTLIQIRGRAVRKNSHIGLPPENNIVNFMILSTSLPDNFNINDFKQLDNKTHDNNINNKTDNKINNKINNKTDMINNMLSYEEEKYRDKINVFKTIQEIEKVFHENAIDAIINKEIIAYNDKSREKDPLAPLLYEPNINKKYDKQFNLDELKLDTFNIYYNKKEINIIKSIVKQLFIEISTVWRYDDLFDAVKNPNFNNPNFNTKNNEIKNPIKNPTNKINLGENKSNKKISFENEINTKLFNEHNFIIALNQLIWNMNPNYNEPFEEKYNSNLSNSNLSNSNLFNNQQHNNPSNINILDKIFNPNDKIINFPNSNQKYVIVPIYDNKKNEFRKQNFYVLLPFNNVNIPKMDIEIPYRINNVNEGLNININSFIQNKKEDFDYDDKKIIFINKWSNISIENMENAICEYGATFHIKLLEECIEYVFNAWTSPDIIKSNNHEFYFKMLYYYDLLQLVIWAYTCKPKIFNNYTKYAIPFKAKDIKLKALEKYEKARDYEEEERNRKNTRRREIRNIKKKGKKLDKYQERIVFKNVAVYSNEDISPPENSDLNSNGIINLLKSSINNSSNIWIPENFREMYNDILTEVDNLFDDRKKKNKYINKVLAKYLPIGHYIEQFPKLYLPEKGWNEDSTYAQSEQEFIENNIIIGYDEKTKTGIHTRFKIRKPIQTIKKYKDIRLIEKGSVCKSKSKSDLKKVALLLNAQVPDKINVDELCSLIRTKLIRAELKERIAKSNIKYFYFHYENRPDIINN